MKRDLFAEYTCTPVEDIPALAEIGITMQREAGTSCLWQRDDGTWMKEIGVIVVWDDTQRIDCIPYRRTNDADRGFLASIAFNAWLAPPTPENEWGHTVSKDGRSYWHQVINAEVENDDHESCRIIAAATSHRERNDHALGFDAA
ncbi:hypothetical protein ACFYY5_28945 [Nocardia elegans]|uniref:Uncharacterized protein n=1 Tax=Nocardia elegans TaxID=300029 RepID=A0ABW6TNG7_9NOCA